MEKKKILDTGETERLLVKMEKLGEGVDNETMTAAGLAAHSLMGAMEADDDTQVQLAMNRARRAVDPAYSKSFGDRNEGGEDDSGDVIGWFDAAVGHVRDAAEFKYHYGGPNETLIDVAAALAAYTFVSQVRAVLEAKGLSGLAELPPPKAYLESLLANLP